MYLKHKNECIHYSGAIIHERLIKDLCLPTYIEYQADKKQSQAYRPQELEK
jgi:hypothetical protein